MLSIVFPAGCVGGVGGGGGRNEREWRGGCSEIEILLTNDKTRCWLLPVHAIFPMTDTWFKGNLFEMQQYINNRPVGPCNKQKVRPESYISDVTNTNFVDSKANIKREIVIKMMLIFTACVCVRARVCACLALADHSDVRWKLYYIDRRLIIQTLCVWLLHPWTECHTLCFNWQRM